MVTSRFVSGLGIGLFFLRVFVVFGTFVSRFESITGSAETGLVSANVIDGFFTALHAAVRISNGCPRSSRCSPCTSDNWTAVCRITGFRSERRRSELSSPLCWF